MILSTEQRDALEDAFNLLLALDGSVNMISDTISRALLDGAIDLKALAVIERHSTSIYRNLDKAVAEVETLTLGGQDGCE